MLSWFPLHFAVEMRSLEMIDILLKQEWGCSLKVIDDLNETPYELASKLKEFDIAKWLEKAAKFEKPSDDPRIYLAKLKYNEQ